MSRNCCRSGKISIASTLLYPNNSFYCQSVKGKVCSGGGTKPSNIFKLCAIRKTLHTYTLCVFISCLPPPSDLRVSIRSIVFLLWIGLGLHNWGQAQRLGGRTLTNSKKKSEKICKIVNWVIGPNFWFGLMASLKTF